MDTPINSNSPQSSSPSYSSVQIAVLAFALLVALVGAVVAFLVRRDITRQVAAAEDKARPAKIRLVKLTAPNCADCFNIETVIPTLKAQPVDIQEERDVAFDSDEGKQLILDHGVQRVPTYLAFGEVSKENIRSFLEGQGRTIGDDMFIFTDVKPVFVEPSTGKERGRLTVTVLADPARCVGCYDPIQLVDQLKSSGVVVGEENVVDAKSEKGKELLRRYTVTKLPTFFIGPDSDVYDIFQTTNLGTKEKDGVFVLRDLPAPHFDVQKGRVVGRVELLLLTDKSCAECYDVGLHKRILQGLGIRPSRERIVDIGSKEGKQLVRVYSITNVPTILLSPDASAYSQLGSVWRSVGTIEKSGWYVFRRPELMGDAIYKDLTKNEIIRPAPKE